MAIGSLTTAFAAVAAITVARTAFAALSVVVCPCIVVSLRRFGRRQARRCFSLGSFIMARTLVAAVFATRCTFTTRGFAAVCYFASIAIVFTRNAFVACLGAHLGLCLQSVFWTAHLASGFGVVG